MSASIQWARGIPVPIAGIGTLGTSVRVISGAQSDWDRVILYRVLEYEQPMLSDFWCYAKLGRVLNNVPNAATVRSYGGLSMYNGLDAAQSAARKYALGTFIAELEVPVNGWFELGVTRRSGHVDVMGDGEHLSRFIRAIYPV